MRTILLVAALVSALVATALAFQWFGLEDGRYTFGWLSWSVVLYLASVLVAER